MRNVHIYINCACFVLTLVSFFPLVACNLDCFSCAELNSTEDCHNVIQCSQSNQRCFTNASGEPGNITYSLGCMDESECLNAGNDQGTGSPSLIGRRSGSDQLCHQCCGVTACNKALCSSSFITAGSNSSGVCADDVSFNCQQVSQHFNICGDVHHAKTVCRKWCGLCDLVDGNWASWTDWSTCSVTCGNGTIGRSRTCTNPSPKHGGLDCTGKRTESKGCALEPCPIHGMWSAWHSWSVCSTTCGPGVTRRHRFCNNPKPSLFGQHCFGEGVDFNICSKGSCGTDGGWSDWATWSTCSSTCDIGLTTRARACNNPVPSDGGMACIGDAHMFTLCHNSVRCFPFGQIYTKWTEWLPCESTIQYRNRTCYFESDVVTRQPCNDTSMNVQYRPCME